MRKEIQIAGFGGQGVIKAAAILSIAAGIYEGYEIAQTQSYGPEARGGACQSEVIISDGEIDYIKTLNIDVFIAMSQTAFDKYLPRIDQKRAKIIIDGTLVTRVPETVKNIFRIDATRLADEEFGNRLYANIIMLGAFSAITGIVDADALKKAISENVPPKTVDANIRAFERGYELGQKLMRQTSGAQG